MKKQLATAALSAALITTASAQVTLNGTKDVAEQGWQKYGGQEVSLAENVVIINDKSAEDTATLIHPIAQDLASEIAKNGLELSFAARTSDAHPSGTGIEIHVVKGLRLVLGLSTYQNKQNIYFHDPVTKKHLSYAIKTDEFVNYRVTWKPGAEGGEVSVFANNSEVISQGHALKSHNWPSRIQIGGLGAGKPRQGKLEIKDMELKALSSDTASE